MPVDTPNLLTTTTLAGHLSAADKGRSDYADARFEVPGGVVRRDVR